MYSLKNKLNVLLPHIQGVRIHYFDYPLHHNIGDLFIYLGAREFLRANNVNVVGWYSLYESKGKSIRERIQPGDVLVFHGGGNFGDIYSPCQELREFYIKNFPDNKILILPQSVFFQSSSRKKEAERIFSAHKNVVVCVRDERSYAELEGFSEQLMLLPDMAHCIDVDKIFIGKGIKSKQFALARTDEEKLKGDLPVQNDALVKDWFDIVTEFEEFKRKAFNVVLRTIGKNIYLSPIFSSLWLKECEKLSARGGCYVSGTEDFVTDRLHGMILAHLLGVKVKVRDNSYGKLSQYYNLWLKDFELVEWL